MGLVTALGVGAAVAGSALSARSQRKAADKAADTSLAVAEQNNALAREIYGENKQTLSPFVNRGNAAGARINDMLGLGGGTAQSAPAPQPNALAQFQDRLPPGYGYGLGDGFSGYNPQLARDAGGFGRGAFGSPTTGFQPNALAQYQAPQQASNITASQAQNDAFGGFRGYIENSDAAFQAGLGMDRINSAMAASGMLQSGAAIKDTERFRQGLQAGYRNEYMNALSGQQGAGLSAAGAQAGVGLNYVGQVSNNNNAAGTAAANAALVKGQNNPFANALGTIGGFALQGGFG